jgi:FMN-dependent NADH-azoreductase
MTTLLKINASLFSTQGQSSQLAERFVAAWLASHPDTESRQPRSGRRAGAPPGCRPLPAFLAKPEERSAEQQAVVAYSDALIEELRQADEIVIGLPMYNFGVPSTLKAYFDHIARAGVTFRYTAKARKACSPARRPTSSPPAAACYAGTPKDSQTTYVRDFLGFIGITDVEFVYAEGLNMGDDSKRPPSPMPTASLPNSPPERTRTRRRTS